MKYFTKLLLIQLFTLFIVTFVARAATDEPKGTIKGTIITAKNEPAANVSVMLKGTSYGAVSDENGRFQFRAPGGKYTLIVSHVGLKNQEIPVEVVNGKTTTVPQITVNISVSTLNEVNVVGNKTNKFATQRTYDVAKMPLNNLENPQVYSTIGADLIAEQNITTVDAALKNAPGVQTMWEATGRGGDGGSYYNLRGFATQSLLRNGIAGNVTNTVDAVDVERIEVVKGPSATLYGNTMSSYGGLINRITKKPYDDFGGEVSYTAGSYGLNRVTLDVNSPLDSAKKVLFRLNTAGTYNGSFTNNGFSRTLAVDPSLTYKATDRLTINFDAEIYTSENTLPPFFFFGTSAANLGTDFADRLPLQYRQSYNAGNLVQSSVNDNFYGQVDYKISDHWRSQTNISSTYSYSNGFGPYYYLLSRDTIGRYDQSTQHSSKYVFEAQENINGDFHIGKLRNRFVGGLDFTDVNSKQMYLEGYLDNVPDQGVNYLGFNKNAMDAIYSSPANYSTFPFMFKNMDYSAYASDILNITDKLLAEAALRVDYFDNKGSYDPSTGVTSGAYHQTALSPKFGLVYQLLKDQVSLFGNYQNGFSNENGVDFNHNPFKPEEANQLEGGAKFDLFDGKLSSTVSYYDIKVKNTIIPDPSHPNFSLQNGSQVSRGIETEVIANPFTGFNIIAGFTHNTSFYTNADPTIEGRRPPTAGSPNNANLWVSYRLPNGALKGLGLGVGGNYASNNAVLNSTTQGVFYLPEYYIFNTNAFYDWSKFHFSFGVNNFTNREWWTGYTTMNPQMLRQFVGSVAFKF
jgi:iron complex outermembrane recepter protein